MIPPAVRAAAARFVPGELVHAEQLGGGYIQDTWRCAVDGRSIVLQRLNTRVFAAPHLVMENVARVCRHLAGDPDIAPPPLLATVDGEAAWVDESGSWWRAFPFVEGSRVLERALAPGHGYETGRVFGRFHARMASFGGPRLHVTIPDFHDTPRRLRALADAATEDPAGRAESARAEIDGILSYAEEAGILQALVAGGRVPLRIAHNDAKIGNVLFDAEGRKALCVVDLDTVMPGLLLHDFGDMIRSTAALGAEDEPHPERVAVSVEVYRAIVAGFLDHAADVITDEERLHLGKAAEVVTLEQAARFLTDHLLGDRYYKVAHPGHNLDRAKAQLALFRALVAERAALRPAG